MLKGKLKNLSDDDLYQCYLDIKEYNKNGVMGNTLVRQIRNELATELKDKNFDTNCMSYVIPSILIEIADRYYNSL